MTTKSTGDALIDSLYQAQPGKVEFIHVPELGFAVVDGHGEPGGADFTAALQALYTVSYGAHFAVKKAAGWAPRVMGLEALWWLVGADAQAVMERMVMGGPALTESDRSRWHWRAMIMQLPPIDAGTVAQVIDQAKARKQLAALDAVRFEHWAEGPSAQIMHRGPYNTEHADIVALHAAITEHGYRPRGRHHEIFLGDPRTSAPERLHTILRHPIESVSADPTPTRDAVPGGLVG